MWRKRGLAIPLENPAGFSAIPGIRHPSGRFLSSKCCADAAPFSTGSAIDLPNPAINRDWNEHSLSGLMALRAAIVLTMRAVSI